MTADNAPADIGGDPESGGWTGGLPRPGVSSPTRCRSCGAAIRWILMESGERMPVDAKPARRVVEQRPPQQTGLFERGVPPELVGVLKVSYRPHWETCPSAQEHRR